jgi:hypothetical protein
MVVNLSDEQAAEDHCPGAERDLAMAQAYTGAGVIETVRIGLKKFASMQAQRELLKLRGTCKAPVDLDELREDPE